MTTRFILEAERGQKLRQYIEEQLIEGVRWEPGEDIIGQHQFVLETGQAYTTASSEAHYYLRDTKDSTILIGEFIPEGEVNPRQKFIAESGIPFFSRKDGNIVEVAGHADNTILEFQRIRKEK